jgi:mRNA interferase MazF
VERLTVVRRGDIFTINFEPRRGSEQGGRRPAVIVSNDVFNKHSPVVTVAPLTHTKRRNRFPHNVEIPPGILDEHGGTVLCGQVVTFSKHRLLRYKGRLPNHVMAEVDEALRNHFDL